MLDDTERHYLTEIAAGRTIFEIAVESGVPVTFIADGINSALAKLDASNMMDAIAKAIRMNLIGWEDDGA